jgi:hypothetical protein
MGVLYLYLYIHTYKHVPELTDGPADKSFLQTAGYVTTGQTILLKTPSNLIVIMHEERDKESM